MNYKLIRNNIFIVCLTTIFILAFVLRFLGIKPGYNQYHPDEDNIYSTTTSFVKNNNFKPLRFDYSSGPALINYYFYKTLFIPLSLIKFFIININPIIDGFIKLPFPKDIHDRIIQFSVFGDRDLNALFWTRYITALFGFMSVILLYVLGTKIFNKYVGFISALFLAVNFKSIQNAHFGLPDSYYVFFLIFTLILCIELIKKGDLKSYLLVGIFSGITFSIKYQTLFIFPVFVSHILSVVGNKKITFKEIFSIKFIALLLLIPLIFLIINPYFLINIDEAVNTLTYISSKYGMGIMKINLYPLYYLINVDYGLPLLLFFILGVIMAFKNRLVNTIYIFIFICSFVYLYFYYSAGGFYVRNLITLSPFIFLFSAYFIFEIYKIAQNKFGKICSFCFIAIVIFLSIYKTFNNSLVNVVNYTKRWNYDVIKDWELDNLPDSIIVASKNFDPIVGRGTVTKTEFEHEGSFSIAEHKENGAEYALLNLDWAGDRFYYWMKFGLDRLDYMFEKPLKEMRNTYFGLASEEFFRYQIFSITKPWQAPDANLIFSKFIKWSEFKNKIIAEYTFNDNLEGWNIIGNTQDSTSYYFEKNNGTIVYSPPNKKFSVERISSPKVNSKPGHLYRVLAYLKSESLIEPKYRDGFIRIDFYKQGDDISLPGLISSVSSRVHSSSDLTMKEIVERAPEESQFFVVSFQASSARTKIYLDSVRIFESEDYFNDITKMEPYIRKEIDLNLLYPYSHGNL